MGGEMPVTRDAIQECLAEIVSQVRALRDDTHRFQALSALLDELSSVMDEMSAVRRSEAARMHAEGMSYSQIANLIGVSKARVQQFVSGAKQPRRPGVIEMHAAVRQAELEAKGRSREKVCAVVVPEIRARRGGKKFDVAAIAAMLGYPESMVRKYDPLTRPGNP